MKVQTVFIKYPSTIFGHYGERYKIISFGGDPIIPEGAGVINDCDNCSASRIITQLNGSLTEAIESYHKLVQEEDQLLTQLKSTKLTKNNLMCAISNFLADKSTSNVVVVGDTLIVRNEEDGTIEISNVQIIE